jgi:hypothetical protein
MWHDVSGSLHGHTCSDATGWGERFLLARPGFVDAYPASTVQVVTLVLLPPFPNSVRSPSNRSVVNSATFALHCATRLLYGCYMRHQAM